jgi:hypothetical protein
MMSFMLWMAGNSVQIFSIMMVAWALASPIRAILNVNNGAVQSRKLFRSLSLLLIIICLQLPSYFSLFL